MEITQKQIWNALGTLNLERWSISPLTEDEQAAYINIAGMLLSYLDIDISDDVPDGDSEYRDFVRFSAIAISAVKAKFDELFPLHRAELIARIEAYEDAEEFNRVMCDAADETYDYYIEDIRCCAEYGHNDDNLHSLNNKLVRLLHAAESLELYGRPRDHLGDIDRALNGTLFMYDTDLRYIDFDERFFDTPPDDGGLETSETSDPEVAVANINTAGRTEMNLNQEIDIDIDAMSPAQRVDHVRELYALLTGIGVSTEFRAYALGKSKHTLKAYAINPDSEMHRTISADDLRRLRAYVRQCVAYKRLLLDDILAGKYAA